MAQQSALNALEPFLALSKSANSPRAAADLAIQATSAPHTYIFAELLETPNIHALRSSPDYAPHLALLEIFAWGTYADYTSSPTPLPALNPTQHQKLLLLTLLPLAASRSTLTYPALLAALPLDNSIPALEALVTAAIYAGLLSATLDPRGRRVAVHAVAPLRDVPPAGVPRMVALMGGWEAKCAEVLRMLEGEVEAVKARARERRGRERMREQAFEAEVEKGMGVEGGEPGGRGKRAVGDEGIVEEGSGLEKLAARGVKRRGGSLASGKSRG